MPTQDIEEKADQMLETWAREMRDSPPGSFGSLGLDGNMALLDTSRHRSKRKDQPSPAYGKETRTGPRCPDLIISPTSQRIERIMVHVRAMDSNYCEVLRLTYTLQTIEEICRRMGMSRTKVKEFKRTAFHIVCALISSGFGR